MSDSLPPYLLRRPGSQPGSAARGFPQSPVETPGTAEAVQVLSGGGQQGAPPLLLAVPGTPGHYEPPVTPAERPETMQELADRVQLETLTPWPAGTWLPLGRRGRRAHWDGTAWKCNNSPGYGGELVTVRSATEQLAGAQ